MLSQCAVVQILLRPKCNGPLACPLADSLAHSRADGTLEPLHPIFEVSSITVQCIFKSTRTHRKTDGNLSQWIELCRKPWGLEARPIF